MLPRLLEIALSLGALFASLALAAVGAVAAVVWLVGGDRGPRG